MKAISLFIIAVVAIAVVTLLPQAALLTFIVSNLNRAFGL